MSRYQTLFMRTIWINSEDNTLNQCWLNVGLWHWTSIKPTLIQHLVSAAKQLYTCEWVYEVLHVLYESRQMVIVLQWRWRDLSHDSRSLRSHRFWYLLVGQNITQPLHTRYLNHKVYYMYHGSYCTLSKIHILKWGFLSQTWNKKSRQNPCLSDYHTKRNIKKLFCWRKIIRSALYYRIVKKRNVKGAYMILKQKNSKIKTKYHFSGVSILIFKFKNFNSFGRLCCKRN